MSSAVVMHDVLGFEHDNSLVDDVLPNECKLLVSLMNINAEM